MTKTIGAAIDRPLRFEPISDAETRRQHAAWGAPQPLVETRLPISRAIREGRLAEVTDRVERALGREAIAFDKWARGNAAAFV
ncbi:MAG TPA: hypothetical protein VGG79_11095 [Roseiarcus sp.]|jgi:hypothetical protein